MVVLSAVPGAANSDTFSIDSQNGLPALAIVSAPAASPPVPLAHLTKESGNQDHWMAAIDGVGDSKADVCKSFGEPRYAVMQRLLKAGVPFPRWEGAPLETFIAMPESFIEPLRSERIHLFVEPVPGVHAQRYKFKNITVADALDVAQGLRGFPDRERYTVTLVESPKLQYHGNVTVFDEKNNNPSATALLPLVVGEFVSGESLPVSRSGVQPEFRFWQEPYLETYKFDFSSDQARAALHGAMRAIPRLSDGLRPQFLPGYYEVGITAAEPGKPSRTYLYDMKSWESL